MNPYMSWAILLVVVGGLGWYYTGGSIPKGKPAVVKPVVEKSEAILSNKKPKRKPKKNPEPNGRATPAAKPEAEPRETPTPTAATESKAVDDEVNNKDFAMQLSKVKNGTAIGPAAKKGLSKKERRSQKLNAKQQGNGVSEQSASHMSTRSSSTTGADADDDMSPVTSPVMAPASKDVSDMLEAPGDGPSVLRLTGELKENKKQKAQSFKPVETKKQRQQKAKNEAKRLQVEEAEKQRRALLEKQLHTSREFERREAAKSKPAVPLTNAWTAKNTSEKTNGVATPPAPAPVNGNTDLLDTFTPVTSKKQNGKAAKDPRPPIPHVPQQRPAAQASEAVSTSKPKNGNWTDELPSEEEQMRILGAMSSENEWTTVPTRKKDKKAAKANGNEVEASAL